MPRRRRYWQRAAAMLYASVSARSCRHPTLSVFAGPGAFRFLVMGSGRLHQRAKVAGGDKRHSPHLHYAQPAGLNEVVYLALAAIELLGGVADTVCHLIGGFIAWGLHLTAPCGLLHGGLNMHIAGGFPPIRLELEKTYSISSAIGQGMGGFRSKGVPE